MRLLTITLLSCFLITNSYAQSEKLKKMERDFVTVNQSAYISKALELSKAFFAEKFWTDAEKEATNALASAKQQKLADEAALAMLRKAQAIVENELQQGKTKRLREAQDLLEKSYEIQQQSNSPNEDILRSTLTYLILVLEKRDKKRDIPSLQQRLDLINAKSEKLQIQAEKQNLEQKTLKLSNDLQQKESVIGSLSEAQAKSELLIAQQRITLDSVSFQHKLSEAALNEARIESALQHSQRNFSIAIATIVFILAAGAGYAFWKQKKTSYLLKEKNNIIEKERQRSEELLLNILPAPIAQELKLYNFARSKRLETVSVLFTDFVNFSKIAEELSPEELVNDLDFCFRQMDNIVMKYGLEKIKTIGDSYMCAGGLPEPSGDTNFHINAVKAALEMQSFLEEWKQERISEGKPVFEARLGIHTGSVVAGVVGTKKFAYDIWGDTVNIASRMQSSGEKGKVNISGDTYELIKYDFSCTYRGKINAKNKENIDMYFVNSEN